MAVARKKLFDYMDRDVALTCVTRQVVVLEQDSVLERLMPALAFYLNQ